jgi:8-oxo-dGTP pyrophosphatase MutT (NUDIX family)
MIVATSNRILKKIKGILTESPISVANSNIAGQQIASVLVIIHNSNNLLHIIFTKRAEALKLHTGEVCFPGGRHDPREDRTLYDTALRETREELGVSFSQKDILGSLKPVRTVTSNFIINPFVTFKHRIPQPQILEKEVEKVIDAPLLDILNSISLDHRHYDPLDQSKELYRFTFDNDIIWGATARILKQLYDACM